jgi:hypothetical protein
MYKSLNHIGSSFGRREFIYTGLLGGLGLTTGDALQAQTESKIVSKAQSVIHIYMPGGAAAQETWDPKIHAPIEFRGPLGSVKTAIPGVHFSEYMKETAKIADKITVVRSMTHGEAAHERGTHNMFTGYRPSPAVKYPSFGSVVAHEQGSRNYLPPYVCVPSMNSEDAGTGYLSKAFGPFSLGSDPASKDFAVRDLKVHPSVSQERFNRRRSILETVDEHFRNIEGADAIASMNKFYQQAYDLVSSTQAREAFELDKEPEHIRNMYGQNQAGQRFLMARRLVEAGVRFVSVIYGGWDMHASIGAGIKSQLPAFDQAYAALINDLDQRGMLNDTIVMVSSEFGRTPKINKDAGRDHWPRVFSVAFAGGGFKRGYIHGSSDATASAPEEKPLTVENMAATIYNQLGIDPNKHLMADGGRPVSIVYNGQVENDLLA